MNSVNGVISNGLAPRGFSIVGSVVSANCTWQDGHHDSTCPLLLWASLSKVPSATRPEGGDIAGAHLHDAAAMGRSAHDLIGDAKRIHDVERKQRDVRGLEHIAAGVENEIRRLLPRRIVLCPLPEPFQQHVIELDAGELRHLARHFSKTVDAVLALYGRLSRARHLHPRHVNEKARIDAIV